MRLHQEDDYYDYAPEREMCDGNRCLVRRDGMHHDKINGPHYWCVECPGCPKCCGEWRDWDGGPE